MGQVGELEHAEGHEDDELQPDAIWEGEDHEDEQTSAKHEKQVIEPGARVAKVEILVQCLIEAHVIPDLLLLEFHCSPVKILNLIEFVQASLSYQILNFCFLGWHF